MRKSTPSFLALLLLITSQVLLAAEKTSTFPLECGIYSVSGLTKVLESKENKSTLELIVAEQTLSKTTIKIKVDGLSAQNQIWINGKVKITKKIHHYYLLGESIEKLKTLAPSEAPPLSSYVILKKKVPCEN